LTEKTNLCLTNIKDVMMVLVLNSEDLTTSKIFKEKWLAKVKMVKEEIKQLSKDERKELDKSYSMWYASTLEKLIPESARTIKPLQW